MIKRALLFCICLLPALGVLAHKPSDSYLTLKVGGAVQLLANGILRYVTSTSHRVGRQW